MDENELIANIGRKTDIIGIELKSLSKSQKDYLYKIENVLIQSTNNINAMLNNLQNELVSIVSLCKKAGISRKTIYNNEFLKIYIDFSIKEQGLLHPHNQIHELKDQILEKQETINKMILRDITQERLKKELEDLHDENKRLRNENQLLSEDIQNLRKQNQEYKRQSEKNKVIKLNG